MNTFLNGLKTANSFGLTENGGIKRTTTGSALLDMFAMGAAFRTRSEEDCILLFKNAYEENPVYALKCLFYIADCRGGQGERRFFRVITRWLAQNELEAMRRNLVHIPIYRRWDDILTFVGTPLQKEALDFLKNQLALDVQSKTPSLLAKWLPSENTSSQKTRELAAIVRKHFGFTPRQYRKTLSILRARINVLETLMSANRWDEIEFDKIPSKAGLKYKNAFARHDIERMKKNPEVKSYEEFAKDTTTKVNAKTLYPYEVVDKAVNLMGSFYRKNNTSMDNTDRLMINKYWENLEDYFKNDEFNMLAVVDTSASMRGYDASAPINVAISLGIYCAERAKGPFAGYYVSFSGQPRLVKVEGVDFCDKVKRIYDANLCQNTNIEATFDMLLQTARKNNCSQNDLPKNLVIISDMEFDGTAYTNSGRFNRTVMETIEKKWNAYGYKMPNLVFWNVQARSNNIPMEAKDGVSLVSGMSPSIFKSVMTGKTASDLMYEALDQERYSVIK